MERFDDARGKALKKLKIADHMLTQTYPLVNDPKLLISVLENIFLALTNGMAAILYFELANKDIPDFEDTFDSKYNLFKFKVVNKYKIDRNYVSFIAEVKDIIVNRKKSPVEFSRKGTFVVCADDYSTQTVTVDMLRKYVTRTKGFIQEVSSILDNKKKVPGIEKKQHNPFANNGWMDAE